MVKAIKVRARCDNGHRLLPENVDHYGKDGYRKSERTKPGQLRWRGCRRCRKDARMRWRIKNALRLVAARRAERKVAPKVKATPKIAAVKVKATPKIAAVKATPKRGNVGCGGCTETFRDAPTASKHFAKEHGKQAAA